MPRRQLAVAIALGRAAIGAGLLLAPGAARAWLGEAAGRPPVKALSRSVAVRDLVLGVATLRAAAAHEPLRPWLRYGAATDAVDCLATLRAFRHLPGPGRALMAGLAGGGAVLGLLLADHVD